MIGDRAGHSNSKDAKDEVQLIFAPCLFLRSATLESRHPVVILQNDRANIFGVLEKHIRAEFIPPQDRFWKNVRSSFNPPLDTWRPRVNGVQLKVLQGARLPEAAQEWAALRASINRLAPYLRSTSSVDTLCCEIQDFVSLLGVWWANRKRGEGGPGSKRQASVADLSILPLQPKRTAAAPSLPSPLELIRQPLRRGTIYNSQVFVQPEIIPHSILAPSPKAGSVFHRGKHREYPLLMGESGDGGRGATTAAATAAGGMSWRLGPAPGPPQLEFVELGGEGKDTSRKGAREGGGSDTPDTQATPAVNSLLKGAGGTQLGVCPQDAALASVHPARWPQLADAVRGEGQPPTPHQPAPLHNQPSNHPRRQQQQQKKEEGEQSAIAVPGAAPACGGQPAAADQRLGSNPGPCLPVEEHAAVEAGAVQEAARDGFCGASQLDLPALQAYDAQQSVHPLSSQLPAQGLVQRVQQDLANGQQAQQREVDAVVLPWAGGWQEALVESSMEAGGKVPSLQQDWLLGESQFTQGAGQAFSLGQILRMTPSPCDQEGPSSGSPTSSRRQPPFVALNVGGHRFLTTAYTLAAVEGSFLWRIAQQAQRVTNGEGNSRGAEGEGGTAPSAASPTLDAVPAVDAGIHSVQAPAPEYFIDRNGKLFEYVLDYLRCQRFGETEGVALPRDAHTLALLQREAIFYQLPGLAGNAAAAAASLYARKGSGKEAVVGGAERGPLPAAHVPNSAWRSLERVRDSQSSDSSSQGPRGWVLDAVFQETGMQPAEDLALAHANLLQQLNKTLQTRMEEGFTVVQQDCGTEREGGLRNLHYHVLLKKSTATDG